METTVFFGPKSEYLKILGDKDYVRLTTLAIFSDWKSREYRLTAQNRKHLSLDEMQDHHIKVKSVVAFSEEYAALNEHAIQSLMSFLLQFDVKELFLHNPPRQVVDQIHKSGFPLVEWHYQYPKIDIPELKAIYQHFEERIVGQDAIRNELLTSLYPLSRTGRVKPVVLLFYGPSGVGKTETARYLADILGTQLFRQQFSMFNSLEYNNYLFGGKHSQASLAHDLLDRESNIILFDEFDKVPPSVYSAFYQMFDEGIFVDKNYALILDRSVIICTTNFKDTKEIKAHLGLPVYSRFDGIFEYKSLSAKAIKTILKRELKRQWDELLEEERIMLDLEAIKQELVEEVPILDNARQVQRIVQDCLTRKILNKTIGI